MNDRVRTLARKSLPSRKLIYGYFAFHIFMGLLAFAGTQIPWVKHPHNHWVDVGQVVLVMSYIFFGFAWSMIQVFAGAALLDYRDELKKYKRKISAWEEKVEPNVTGPEFPQNGWTVWWPVRHKGTKIIEFVLEKRVFNYEYNSWKRPGYSSSYEDCTTFVSIDDTSALAGAWADLCLEAKQRNRRAWDDVLESRRIEEESIKTEQIEEQHRESIFQDPREIMRGA